MPESRPVRIRIDKWLWYARFYKTRPLAQSAAESGVLRLNGARVLKPSTAIGPGDILTVPQRGARSWPCALLACGTRRGPAPEAQRALRNPYETVLDRGAPAP